MLTSHAEVKVNSKWITADTSLTSAYEAGLGLPITRFGENTSAWRNLPQIRFDRMPVIFSPMLIYATVSSLSKKMDKQIARDERKGQKVLDILGLEEYDRRARRRWEFRMPKLPNLDFSPTMDVSVPEGLVK